MQNLLTTTLTRVNELALSSSHKLPTMKHDDFQDDEDYISKSQLKRDAEALQDLGVELLALPESEQQKLDLPEALVKAISDTKRIKSLNALRRQEQLIGRLMRRMDDVEPIRQVIAQQKAGSRKIAREHQRIEQYRDRLISGDNALLEQLLVLPGCDAQQLRQLVRQAQQQNNPSQQNKAFKKLFPVLKALSFIETN